MLARPISSARRLWAAGPATLPASLAVLPAAANLQGTSPYETHLLRAYLEEAHAYVRDLGGVADVRRAHYGAGFGGVLGIFLMEVAAQRQQGWHWVIVGDPPASHFPVADAPTPRAALEHYCRLAERWLDTVGRRASVAEIPFRAAATPEVARVLAAKLHTLRLLVLPAVR